MGLRTMVTDFPVIRYPLDHQDSTIMSVGWASSTFSNIVSKFLQGDQWLKERINYSRYSYIPLGNLEEDSELAVIDTLYARNLTLNRHVLWYSNTSLPDLGGHEDQDYRSYFQDEIENPEFIKKGFYRGYTIEIEVSNLAVNTILQSEFLKEFEEATMDFSGTNNVYDNKGSKEK
jgi:DNA polymerase epsilon subunit 1